MTSRGCLLRSSDKLPIFLKFVTRTSNAVLELVNGDRLCNK